MVSSPCGPEMNWMRTGPHAGPASRASSARAGAMTGDSSFSSDARSASSVLLLLHAALAHVVLRRRLPDLALAHLALGALFGKRHRRGHHGGEGDSGENLRVHDSPPCNRLWKPNQQLLRDRPPFRMPSHAGHGCATG